MSIDSAIKGSLFAHVTLLAVSVIMQLTGYPIAGFWGLAMISYLAFLFPATAEVLYNPDLSTGEKKSWLCRLFFMMSLGGLLYYIRGRRKFSSWP